MLGTKAALTEDWRYSYDALGRLRRVGYKAAARPTDSTVARYGYDVLRRRIAKRVYRAVLAGSVVGERRFVYHGDHVAYETNEAGTIKMKYAWGTGVDDLMGVEDSTGTFYHVVQDQLGSVRGLVTRDGTWRMHQRFTPYGTLLARDSAGALPPLRTGWTGREYDAESGLYFFRARYYDPRQRRFTQEDPIGYGGGGNLYAYVGGAVLEARDPSGLYKDCSYGACGNPHDWSGVPGLDAAGASLGGGGYRGLGTSELEMWANWQTRFIDLWAAYQAGYERNVTSCKNGPDAILRELFMHDVSLGFGDFRGLLNAAEQGLKGMRADLQMVYNHLGAGDIVVSGAFVAEHGSRTYQEFCVRAILQP